eukprot:c33648_g1_i1 orf=92-385(+)
MPCFGMFSNIWIVRECSGSSKTLLTSRLHYKECAQRTRHTLCDPSSFDYHATSLPLRHELSYTRSPLSKHITFSPMLLALNCMGLLSGIGFHGSITT